MNKIASPPAQNLCESFTQTTVQRLQLHSQIIEDSKIDKQERHLMIADDLTLMQ